MGIAGRTRGRLCPSPEGSFGGKSALCTTLSAFVVAAFAVVALAAAANRPDVDGRRRLLQETPSTDARSNFQTFVLPEIALGCSLFIMILKYLSAHPPRLGLVLSFRRAWLWMYPVRLRRSKSVSVSPSSIADKKHRNFSSLLHKHFQHPDGKRIRSGKLPNILTVQMLHDIADKADQFWPLLKMAGPAVASMAFYPFVSYGAWQMLAYYWPAGFVSINDSLVIWLTPASLLYTLVFGFSFQSALDKFSKLTKLMFHEISLLFTLTNLVVHLGDEESKDAHVTHCKSVILRMVREHAIAMSRQLAQSADEQLLTSLEFDDRLWLAIPMIRQIDRRMDLDRDRMTGKIQELVVDTILELAKTLNERTAISSTKVNALQWILLLFLGYVVLFMLFLVRSGSPDFESLLVTATATSIGFMVFILADLDDPFHGFFRVKLVSLGRLVHATSDFIEELDVAVASSQTYERRRGGAGELPAAAQQALAVAKAAAVTLLTRQTAAHVADTPAVGTLTRDEEAGEPAQATAAETANDVAVRVLIRERLEAQGALRGLSVEEADQAIEAEGLHLTLQVGGK